MKKVSIIGHYAHGFEYLDGQTVKTKTVTNALIGKYGSEEILQFDTHGKFKALLKSPIYVLKAMKESKNIIILPAHNGLEIFGRLLPLFKKIFKNRKIHYIVIGGWLPTVLENNKGLAKSLKNFDYIFVETSVMKKKLELLRFENVIIMPNFKKIYPLSFNNLVYQNRIPLKLCTFSRVMREKGIDDAIEVVKAINMQQGKIVYSLDIYGQIDNEQKEWFEKLKSEFPEYIRYKGIVPFEKTVEIIKNYFILLFPTKFYTEGVPGTIIDAYAAGVPVISAKWQNFYDVVDENVTGIGYEFNNVNDLKQKLLEILSCIDEINYLKSNCIEKCKKYTLEESIKILYDKLG